MKKTVKSLFCLALCAVLAGGLFGCGRRGEPVDPNPPTPPPSEPTAIADYVRELSKDEYTVDLTDRYGLSDPADVGVVKGEVAERYPLPADDEFAAEAVFRFTDYEDGSGGSDARCFEQTLAAALAYQEEHHVPVKVKLPARPLLIRRAEAQTSTSTQIFSVKGFDGLYLEGAQEGTTLLVDPGETWMGGISFTDNSDLHLANIVLDYSVSPSLTGVVKSADAEALTVTMDIPASFNETVEAYQSRKGLSSKLHSYIEYSPVTGAPKQTGNILINGDGMFDSFAFQKGTGADGLDAYTLTVAFKKGYAQNFKTPETGDKVALGFAMYSYNGMSFGNCQDVTVENCTIHACPGMAVTVSEVENFAANRFDIELSGDRLMTATADGYHLSGCTGNVEITNCLMENTHDDALNIKHGYWYNLNSVDAQAHTITINKKTGAIPEPQPGDVIEIYGQEKFDLRDSFTVVSVTGTSASYAITVKERISGNIDFTKCVASNVSRTARFTFRNNIVRNKRNRGILVQVRGAVIENNTFENVGHGAVMIHSSLDVFNESTLPRNMTVRNNKLMNNGYLLSLRGDISVFAIGATAEVAPPGTLTGIEIANNFIARTGNAGVSLRGVGGGDSFVKNNLFYNAARVHGSELTDCCVELDNVRDIEISGNYNYYTLDSETFAGLIPAGLTDKEKITVKDNINLGWQEIEGEVKTFNVAKVGADAVIVDGKLDEWAAIGTAIELVGSSLATGEELLPSQYENYFGVKLAKLAWNDKGIYFAFDVKDNELNVKSTAGFWEGDCVEIFMSNLLTMPSADFKLFKDSADVLQMAFAPTWTNKYTYGDSRTNTKFLTGQKPTVEVVTTAEGYAGEMFMPFTAADGMQASIAAGEPIACAFIFADCERTNINRKRLQVGNVPHFVETYKTKTAKMPQYYFVQA